MSFFSSTLFGENIVTVDTNPPCYFWQQDDYVRCSIIIVHQYCAWPDSYKKVYLFLL